MNELVSSEQTLANKVESILKKYLVLSDDDRTVIVLWLFASYKIDSFHIFPLLCISSPTKGCGKTTILDVLGSLCNKPQLTSNTTAAAIFRTTDKERVTLLFDEVDTYIEEKSSVHQILNTSHRRSTAYVSRCEGKEYKPKRLLTWGPKAYAMIGYPPETLRDRSLIIQPRKKKASEKVVPFRFGRDPELAAVQEELAAWDGAQLDAVLANEPNLPSFLPNRLADNWLPLFAVSEVIGLDWRKRAEVAARHAAQKSASELDLTQMLLKDIKKVVSERGESVIKSAELVEGLRSLEDGPWRELGGAPGVTAASLAKHLRPFGISTKNHRFSAEKVQKAYHLSDFDDAFDRYLPENVGE